MGASLLAESDWMVVSSSNFDLRYNSGQIHLIDLNSANAALADDSPNIPLSEVSLAHLQITSFGSAPVFLSAEDKLMGWVHRDQTGLFAARVKDDSSIDCLGNFVEVCGAMQEADTMASDPARPFSDGTHLWVPHLSEGVLTVFAPEEDSQWTLKAHLDLSDTLSNVRAGTYSESTSGAKRVWLSGLFYNGNTMRTESTLVWFLNPVSGSDVEIEGSINITAATGSTTINALSLSADESQLFLALRNPDGIASFEVAQNSYQTPQLRMRELTGSCDDPTRITPFDFEGVNYLAVSCFDEDALWIYRASDMQLVSLREDDGRGPKDVLWDENHQTLWVTYFKSHFLGAYQFQSNSTSIDLVYRGRLGLNDNTAGATP